MAVGERAAVPDSQPVAAGLVIERKQPLSC